MRGGRAQWRGSYVVRRSKLFGGGKVGMVGRLSRIARGSAGSGRGQGKQAQWMAAGVKQLGLRLEMPVLVGGQDKAGVGAGGGSSNTARRGGRRSGLLTRLRNGRGRRQGVQGVFAQRRGWSGDGKLEMGFRWMDKRVQCRQPRREGRGEAQQQQQQQPATSSEAALEDRRKPPASNRRR